MDGMAQQSGNRDYDYIDHVNRQKYELESQLKVWKERCRGLEQERESLHAQMQIFFAMAAETAPQLLENIRMQLSRRVQDSAPIPNYGPGKLPSMRPDKPILQPMLTQPSAGKTRAVSQSRMSGQQEGMVARQQRTGPSPFQPHVSIAPPLQGMHSAGMPMQPSSTSMQPMLAPLRFVPSIPSFLLVYNLSASAYLDHQIQLAFPLCLCRIYRFHRNTDVLKLTKKTPMPMMLDRKESIIR